MVVIVFINDFVCVPFIGIAVGVDRGCSWGVTLPQLSRWELSLGANQPLTSIDTKSSSGGKGSEWSSQPPESRMAATSLKFLLLLLLHLVSPAPAPAAEVREVHSPALGEVVQVGKSPPCVPRSISRWCHIQRRRGPKVRQSALLFS